MVPRPSALRSENYPSEEHSVETQSDAATPNESEVPSTASVTDDLHSTTDSDVNADAERPSDNAPDVATSSASRSSARSAGLERPEPIVIEWPPASRSPLSNKRHTTGTQSLGYFIPPNCEDVSIVSSNSNGHHELIVAVLCILSSPIHCIRLQSESGRLTTASSPGSSITPSKSK